VKGAAHRLAVTPSAVSQSLRRLEDELGVRLFQRIGNRVEATDDAGALATVVGDFEQTLASTTDRLRARRHQPEGVVRIGAPFDFGTRVVLPALERLERFAKLSFEVSFGAPHVLAAGVIGGQLELAYCDDHPLLARHQRLLGFRRVFREHLLLVGARAFVAKRVAGDVSLRHLRTLPHVEYVRDRSVLGLWYRHHFGKLPTGLDVRLIVDNVHAVVAGIRAGLGLGIAPEHVVRNDLARGTLHAITTRKAHLPHDIVLAQRADRVPTVGERAVIDAVRASVDA
jgi:DNA-binding transcriptional LysR family regulator